MKDLNALLAARRAEGLYRTRLALDTPQTVEIQVGGERLLSFCSNDYLGLAAHPAVIHAFQAGASRYGVGAGASHLISGHSRAHEMLEEELADFVQCERVLLFSAGYMANLGVIAALARRDSYLYGDALNHASLIDGARVARTRSRPYRHRDVTHLRQLLKEEERPGERLIATDAVFSMDGDLAPLPELFALAREAGAWLVIDDAHGFGVLGSDGRGSLEHRGLPARFPAVLMGTLGKALGTYGAFVGGEAVLVDALVQYARTYIYTTALPPAVAEATRASLRIARSEPWRRTRLKTLVARFRRGAAAAGLKLTSSETAIQPVILGSSARALAAAARLRARGLLIPAIRPPTVPADSARLRITFSSAHSEAHIDRLLEELAPIARDGELADAATTHAGSLDI